MKHPWTLFVLGASALWVFYHAIFSGSILYFDALGYDTAGQALAQGKFYSYFAQGPGREPLYPLFIAFNIKIAAFLGLAYLQVLLLTQGVILLLSQLMLARILMRVSCADWLIALVTAYFVLSPTVLRSSLIMYSEIITYPCVLLIAGRILKTWEHYQDPVRFEKEWFKDALQLGASFLPLMFVKGITELMAPVVLIVFFGILAVMLGRKSFLKVIMALVLAWLAFLIPVLMYKGLNKMLNGQFAFTNRGSWALYGTAARRALPTNPQQDLAQRYYVLPDKSICEKKVSAQDCAHWFYTLSDELGIGHYQKYLKQGLEPAVIDKAIVADAVHLMLKNPVATLNGMFWEGAKLIFWEYPSWGMVILPRATRVFYEQPIMKTIFLWGVNGLSLVFFIAGVILALLPFRASKKKAAKTLAMMALFGIIIYTTAHSFFFLNERNALPIVSLFLILFACVVTILLPENKKDITNPTLTAT